MREWKTIQEINTKEVRVERAIDGSDFKQIGTVDAHNNTTGETAYRFTDDKGIVAGTYIYRLKMVDLDGNFSYSNNISLKIKDPVDVEVIGNPFTNSIKIKTARNVQAYVRLMDI